MARKIIADGLTVRVQFYKMQQLGPPDSKAYTRVEDYAATVSYMVELDFAGVASLARRAARNKSGHAVDGPLRVSVTKVSRDGQQATA